MWRVTYHVVYIFSLKFRFHRWRSYPRAVLPPQQLVSQSPQLLQQSTSSSWRKGLIGSSHAPSHSPHVSAAHDKPPGKTTEQTRIQALRDRRQSEKLHQPSTSSTGHSTTAIGFKPGVSPGLPLCTLPVLRVPRSPPSPQPIMWET